MFCVSRKRGWFPTFVQLKIVGKMKRNSFNVLFFIKKAKLLKNGEASVCMRITVNGARMETNIRKSIDPASWNQTKECARGKSRKACDLNAYIENAKIKLHQIFNGLENSNNPLPPDYCRKSSSGRTRSRKKSARSSVPRYKQPIVKTANKGYRLRRTGRGTIR